MCEKSAKEIIVAEEINLYGYWKILVKRKKIFLGMLLIPLVVVTIVSFIIPRYYRGEIEINLLKSSTMPSMITSSNVVKRVGNIDDDKKNKIFKNNSDAIKNLSIAISQKSDDKINIIIVGDSPDIIPQAIQDVLNYINSLPYFVEEIIRIQRENERAIEEIDLKIRKLVEVRKMNLIFLNEMSDMIKKRKLTVVNFNPADLVRKDGDLLLEIKNLEQAKSEAIKRKALNVKINAGILDPPYITKQPANAQIKKIIAITCTLSLIAAIFIVFFLEYIEQMKARENK